MITVNLRNNKNFKRVKDSYFFSFILLIVALGFIAFSQSNFDEEKVNESIYSALDSAAYVKDSLVSLRAEEDERDFKPNEEFYFEAKSQKMISQQRPKRRPFSTY